MVGCGLDRGNPMNPASRLPARAVTPQALAGEAPRASVSGGGFFPLALGNHWEYATGFDVKIIYDAGGESATLSDPGSMTARLTSIQSFFGRDYVEDTQE